MPEATDSVSADRYPKDRKRGALTCSLALRCQHEQCPKWCPCNGIWHRSAHAPRIGPLASKQPCPSHRLSAQSNSWVRACVAVGATAQFDANFQIALARARCLTWGKQLRGRNPDAEWFIADPRVCSEWPSDTAQQSQRSCSNRGLEKGLVVVTRGATVQRLAFSQGQI